MPVCRSCRQHRSVFPNAGIVGFWGNRHIFLFDVAVIVCKRRGDLYEMKDVIDLNYFKITNNPTTDRDSKKVSGLEIKPCQSPSISTNMAE